MIGGRSIRDTRVTHGMAKWTVLSRWWVLVIVGLCYSLAYWPFFVVMHLRSRAWASSQVLAPLDNYWNWFYRTIFSRDQVLAAGRSSDAVLHPWFMLASISVIGVLYVGIVLLLRTQDYRVPFRWLVGITLLASVPLLLLPNLLSSDVYSYMAFGRIAAVYGGNPFTEPPIMFSADPFYRWVGWRNVPSVYGPTWIYVSMVLTAIVEAIHSHVVTYVLAYKFLAFGLHVVNGWLIWIILERWQPEQRRWGTALYLLNPLVMIEFVGNAHNDVLMITFILLAWWLHLRGRWAGAIVALTLAVLAKWIALVLLPLYGLALLWEASSWRERFWRAGLSLFLFVGLCVMLYRPYWEGPRTLKVLVDAPPQQRLINSLADVVSYDIQRSMARLDLWPNPAIIDSITIFAPRNQNASLLLRQNDTTDTQSVWQQQAQEFAQDRIFFRQQQAVATENRQWLNDRIRVVALAIVAVACLIGAALTRSFKHAVLAGAWIFFVYCAIGAVWFWPWYLTWFVALAALLDWRVTGRTAIMVSLLAPLIYIFFPQTVDPAWWQQYRAVLVFMPPLLFAAWHGWRFTRDVWRRWREEGHTPLAILSSRLSSKVAR